MTVIVRRSDDACSACADQESLQDVRQLPAPAVEQLLSLDPGVAIVGACPVGDALMGTALMATTSDRKLHCLQPSGDRKSEMVRVPYCEILGDPRYVFHGWPGVPCRWSVPG